MIMTYRGPGNSWDVTVPKSIITDKRTTIADVPFRTASTFIKTHTLTPQMQELETLDILADKADRLDTYFDNHPELWNEDIFGAIEDDLEAGRCTYLYDYHYSECKLMADNGADEMQMWDKLAH
jgi:hypothetical protein